MHKFFDYLEPDLPITVIRDLLGYIRRFTALFSGGVPVEGAMDGVGFCHGAGRRRHSRPLGTGGPPAHPAGRHGVSAAKPRRLMNSLRGFAYSYFASTAAQ